MLLLVFERGRSLLAEPAAAESSEVFWAGAAGRVSRGLFAMSGVLSEFSCSWYSWSSCPSAGGRPRAAGMDANRAGGAGT